MIGVPLDCSEKQAVERGTLGVEWYTKGKRYRPPLAERKREGIVVGRVWVVVFESREETRGCMVPRICGVVKFAKLRFGFMND